MIPMDVIAWWSLIPKSSLWNWTSEWSHHQNEGDLSISSGPRCPRTNPSRRFLWTIHVWFARCDMCGYKITNKKYQREKKRRMKTRRESGMVALPKLVLPFRITRSVRDSWVKITPMIFPLDRPSNNVTSVWKITITILEKSKSWD